MALPETYLSMYAYLLLEYDFSGVDIEETLRNYHRYGRVALKDLRKLFEFPNKNIESSRNEKFKYPRETDKN